MTGYGLDQRDITLRVTIGGQMFVLDRQSARPGSGIFRIHKNGLSGFEAPEHRNTTAENAQVHGSYLEDQRITEREIKIKFDIVDYANTEKLRLGLLSAMRPAAEVTVDVIRAGQNRSIDGYITGSPRFAQATLYDFVTVTLTILCPVPFFRDTIIRTIAYRQVVPLWAYPLSPMVGVGVTAGMQILVTSKDLQNTGDVPSGIIATITANAGPVSKPGIILDRQPGEEYIQLMDVLPYKSTAVISTLPRRMMIQVDGLDHFMFDRDSTFFSLPLGISTLRLTAETPEDMDSATAQVQYYQYYMGV